VGVEEAGVEVRGLLPVAAFTAAPRPSKVSAISIAE
jgi:hypothetical protein